ncbi:guanine deaminase [Procambarus clarkii]|uniref:guanine deaminase n=1 Tax=Procambarus clarkii TaxID=6728 RepID=UPI003744AD1D
MKVLRGTFVHSTPESPMVVLTDRVMGVLGTKIVFLEEGKHLEQLKAKHGFGDSCISFMTPSQFVMPGLVDTHTHAPQFPNNGLKLDRELFGWVHKYTLPLEVTFSCEKVARDVFKKVVNRLLCNGTTTAVYHAGLYLTAAKILVDEVHAKGQRALVGKDNMILNLPEYYCEAGVEASLRETEDFIQYVMELKSPIVEAILTPRFGPGCPREQLEGLGKLAGKYNLHVQSHLAEINNRPPNVEHGFHSTMDILNDFKKVGLLGNKTLMAHCVWLKEEELEQLARAQAGVAHCPNSNLSLRSGLCDVRRFLDRGIKVGLGTDCSAGYCPSILDAIRQALQVSKTLAILKPGYQFLSIQEAFRLATLGGAELINMENRIGNFEVGKDFDALLVDVDAPRTPLDTFSNDTAEDKVQRFLYNGDDRNIVQVFVAGSCVVDHTAARTL